MKKPRILALAAAALFAVAPMAKAQHDLYTARITSEGMVELTFDTAQCRAMAQAMLGDRPGRAPRGAAIVRGIEGKAVQLLRANFGPDWNPVLAVRTVKGHVYLLNIQEAISDGDMTCGRLHGIEGAKNLRLKKPAGLVGPPRAEALVAGGRWATFVGSDAESGYYAIDNHDIIVHITRDYGYAILRRKGEAFEPIVKGTWYQSWAGSGMIVMTCSTAPDHSGAMQIEMYGGDDNPEHPSFSMPDAPDSLSLPEGKLRATLLLSPPHVAAAAEDR